MSDEWEPKFRVGQVVTLAGDKRPATVIGYINTADQVLVGLPHGNGTLRKVVNESEISA